MFSTLMLVKQEKGEAAKIGLLVPFYTYHLRQIQLVFGHDPLFINTNDDFTPNWTAIQEALTQGIQLLIICNPGNPQGSLLPLPHTVHALLQETCGSEKI
jgi:aspartate/methionine/tyrosine aminotransferase